MWDAILEYDKTCPQGKALKKIHLVNIAQDITEAIKSTLTERVQSNIGQRQWKQEMYFDDM